jgi:hypothetical protein
MVSLAIVIAALAATIVVYGITPHDDDIVAPFVVRGQIGDELTGRTVSATVTGVRLASSFDLQAIGENWTGPTTGTWVVVDAAAAAVDEPGPLVRVTLTIGDDTFTASERLGSATLQSARLRPGILTRGSLIFEVSGEALASDDASHAEIGINASLQSVLDSRLVIEVDLRQLVAEDGVSFEAPEDVL